MPIAPVLQRFVDEELGRAPAQIERAVASTLQLLREPKEAATNSNQRTLHFALVEALQTHSVKHRQLFSRPWHEASAMRCRSSKTASQQRSWAPSAGWS